MLSSDRPVAHQALAEQLVLLEWGAYRTVLSVVGDVDLILAQATLASVGLSGQDG